jgi:hypothetical protein
MKQAEVTGKCPEPGWLKRLKRQEYWKGPGRRGHP